MVAALIACGPDYPPLPLGVARESACVGDGNTAHGGSLDVAVDDGSDVVASGRLARCGMRVRLFLAEFTLGPRLL